MDEKCLFECTNNSPYLITCDADRVETIKKCSLKHSDGLTNKLDGVDSVKCHKNCVSTYTLAHHIKRFLSKQNDNSAASDEVVPLKKTRHSRSQDFSFKDHCLFCGESCVPSVSSSRHPVRWRKVVQC